MQTPATHSVIATAPQVSHTHKTDYHLTRVGHETHTGAGSAHPWPATFRPAAHHPADQALHGAHPLHSAWTRGTSHSLHLAFNPSPVHCDDASEQRRGDYPRMQLLCVLLLAWARAPAPKAVTDGPMADRSRPAALEKVGVQSQVSMHHAEKADGVATGVARSAWADFIAQNGSKRRGVKASVSAKDEAGGEGSPHPFLHNSSRAVAAAIVMPIHPAKYAQLLDFVESMLRCGQHRHFLLLLVLSTASDEAALAAIFRADRLATDLQRLCSDGTILTTIAHEIPEILARNGTTETIRSLKAYRGLEHAFSAAMPHVRFAMTVDGDSEFQSALDFSSHFANWARQKLVLGGLDVHTCHRLSGYCTDWWADAPIFERDGFSTFVSTLYLSPARTRLPWDMCA